MRAMRLSGCSARARRRLAVRAHSPLPYGCVQIQVAHLRVGSHVWFEDANAFLRQDLADITLGIPQVTEYPRTNGARLHAGRGQPLRYSVVAPGALVGNALVRQEITGTVRTGLDAVSTANAPALVDQYHAVLRRIGSSDRADLDARWFLTLVAELGDEEALANVHPVEFLIHFL